MVTNKSARRLRTVPVLIGVSIAVSLLPFLGRAAEDEPPRLARQLQPLLDCLSGKRETFTIAVAIDAKIDGSSQHLDARLVRYGHDSFDLDVTHRDYAVQLRRRADATAMALPLHGTVFLGRGGTDPNDHLAPHGIVERLLSPGSAVFTFQPLLAGGDADAMVLVLSVLLGTRYDPATSSWNVGKVSLQFSADGSVMDGRAGDSLARLVISGGDASERAVDAWPGMRIVELDRSELERQLVRGVWRAGEILTPGAPLTSPPQTARKSAHGELRWIEGQRVALLHGTPEQIGQAHGELLKQEAMRCIDSVLCTFGTAQTIRTGRWFRHDLADAYARLAPHIPERHKAETRAMAASLGIEDELGTPPR